MAKKYDSSSDMIVGDRLMVYIESTPAEGENPAVMTPTIISLLESYFFAIIFNFLF